VEFVDNRPVTQILGRVVGRDSAGRIAEVRQERSVARRLRRLPVDWAVINDLNLRALPHNVDHVAIGPGGIFCLSTSDHRGSSVWVTEESIRVNNYPVDHLSKARARSRALHRDLGAALGRDVHVRTVVVVRTNHLSIRTQPLGGCVVEARRICSWLRNRPTVMGAAEVSSVVAALRRADS
jgi:hypothetical protein